MAERIGARDIELRDEKVVRVNRTSAVVKGGRRFSFSALVIVGDRRGVVGWGQGKAREVPTSIEKAVRDARKNLTRYPMRGDTIPHEVWGHYGSARVLLKPAAPGTGIKAGASVRAVVEELGVRNLLTKVYGSRNPLNVVKAVFDGLDQLLSKEQVFSSRGLPVHADRDRPKLDPVEQDHDDRPRRKDTRKQRGGADGARGKGRGRGGRGEQRAETPAAEASQADAPAADAKPAEGEGAAE
jgi:small subunit ribosomal protein S5